MMLKSVSFVRWSAKEQNFALTSCQMALLHNFSPNHWNTWLTASAHQVSFWRRQSYSETLHSFTLVPNDPHLCWLSTKREIREKRDWLGRYRYFHSHLFYCRCPTWENQVELRKVWKWNGIRRKKGAISLYACLGSLSAKSKDRKYCLSEQPPVGLVSPLPMLRVKLVTMAFLNSQQREISSSAVWFILPPSHLYSWVSWIMHRRSVPLCLVWAAKFEQRCWQ